MPPSKDTITIEEVEQVTDTLSVTESVTKTLSTEEINTYSHLTDTFLSTVKDLSFDTRLMGLTLLKTLSHLSGSKEKLYSQFKTFPLDQNRPLFYAVPFLSEIAGKGAPLKWHEDEMKYVSNLKIQKGDYSPLRLMILLYESTIFQAIMDKKNTKQFFMNAEQIFMKIRKSILDLQKAIEKKDKQHYWLSWDKTSIFAFKQIAFLWKTVIDSTTVRHGSHLPPKFRRPQDKLPFAWRELIKIKAVKKISMINAIYPLQGLSSQCREIRTYSSFLLHQVCTEKEGFLENFKHTQVEKHFLNRLQIGYRLKESFPNLPEALPEKFQIELFLVLIEQAVNSLAKKHNLGSSKVKDVQSQFSKFNEQVQTQDEIIVDIPDDDEGFNETDPDPAKELAEEELKETTSSKATIETDFPALTDDMELGMGIQTIPYIFPFQYQEEQEEIPLEHIPNIKWDELHWHAVTAGGIGLKVAETKLFINKLEIIYAYRYDIYSIKEIKGIKSFQQYTCFIGKVEEAEKTSYYILKKGGKKTDSGKSIVYIKIDLSEEYIKNIDKAFFFIFPAPYSQHILVIPR